MTLPPFMTNLTRPSIAASGYPFVSNHVRPLGGIQVQVPSSVSALFATN